MQQLVNNRWFALSEFIFATAIGALILIQPQWGGWLVILILLPWLFRLISGRITFEKTAFVIPIGLIVITAAIGVWAAYDHQAAIEKLWVIIGAVAVFVALVNQPRANLGVVASLVGLMGVFIAIIFLFTNDWHTQSSDLELIKRAGDWIMANRPPVNKVVLTPNFAGGLLAILAPIPFALGIHAWRKGNLVQTILSIGMGMVILTALFLSSSRGAWLALFVGIGLWLLWRFSMYLSLKAKKSPILLFGLLLLIILLPLLWVISIFPGGVVELAERLPGLPTGGSRYDLAVNTGKLIGDYPFTGGGLRSFPGQYSQYMLVTPFFLFAYSHNFYLDVIFEQGFLGGLAILVIIVSAAWLLMAKAGSSPKSTLTTRLSAAVIISTFVILLHGLVDDPLYGDLGSPLLLLVPGMALLLAGDYPVVSDKESRAESDDPRKNVSGRALNKIIIPSIVVILTLAGIAIFRKPIFASWYSNLGAAQMAKWELANWPKDQWNADSDVSPLEPAQQLFDKAVSIDPDQRTAWHRSGLIAMQMRDFDAAQVELEQALKIDPEHNGIRKSLGYVYVWNGHLDQAASLLEGIDEAKDEMEAYAWWWGENKRPDLADQAIKMAQILNLETSDP
ncbi:MAG: O-antigen ligase family protein [Anaerolineales bacterium]